MTARHTWLIILATAAVHDLIAHDDQLTDTARAWTRQHPVIMRVALAVMALHLSGDCPRYLDPISGLGWIASHARA
jgi:hypothetical protein